MSLNNDSIDAHDGLSRKHPRKGYVPYRVTTKLWRYMLLNRRDTVTVEGKVKKIFAKSLGVGVYELSLKWKE
jgi:hypothetical protein